jgi:hypothetical protein
MYGVLARDRTPYGWNYRGFAAGFGPLRGRESPVIRKGWYGMSVIDEPVMTDVAFREMESAVDLDALARNEREVMDQNRLAMSVESEDFKAFLDLLSGADAEYLDAREYVAPPADPMLDWDAVNKALNESQQILIGVQNLLSETLAAMGVEDHQYIRVYADTQGDLRLVSEHPRREEIESALNSPANYELRNLYHAAMAGMSLAGGLVGTMSVPDEVLAKVKAKHHAA